MNKNTELTINKQIKAINKRIDVLTDKMNSDFNDSIQELLRLSVLLKNLETGGEALNINNILLK